MKSIYKPIDNPQKYSDPAQNIFTDRGSWYGFSLPDSNNPNPLQDTGLAIMTFEIQGYFDETDTANTGTGSSSETIEQLRDWLREDKTNSVYTFGCFGITNTLRPEFNVEPDHDGETNERGLILEHFEINQDYEFIGKTGFLCRFRYNGDILGLGA